MNTQEILHNVRLIINGHQPEIDISPILYYHRCYYLLSRIHNSSLKQQLIKEKIIETIAIRERYIALKSLWNSSHISYAVMKGAVLSRMAYEDTAIRFSGDIDILIDKSDADAIKDLLYTNGFVQGRIVDNSIQPFSRREVLFQTAMSHQTAPYVKATGNTLCPFINVDINTSVMWGESDQKFDVSSLLKNVVPINVGGIKVNKLSNEEEFLSLCLHHYKDANSIYLLYHGSLKMGLFCDIYYYLRNAPLDNTRLLSLIELYNIGEYVYYCIYYTDALFDDEKLKQLMTLLYKFRNEDLLGSFGLSNQERKQWCHPFFDRLFAKNISQYMEPLLTEEDRNKLNTNLLYM